MRLLKAFLAGVTGLFVIITLFSLIIPSRVYISRGTIINNSTAAEVYQEVARFENWKKWHPIFTVDSATLVMDTTTRNGLATGCRIRHRNMQLTIHLQSADTSGIQFLLEPENGNEVSNHIIITDSPSSGAVTVEWRAVIQLRWYPWEKFYGIFADKLTGPGYDNALAGLKQLMEKISGADFVVSTAVMVKPAPKAFVGRDL